MWKSLVVLAIVANSALITPSEGTKQHPGPYSEESGRGNPHRKCKRTNEIYDLCPNPCPPRECGVNKALILCAPAPKPGSSDCKPGCRCADGFLKNRAGTCIPEKECKYDCAKNETLDPCFSDCPPRLCGVNIAAVSCLAIEECDCERGCRCSDGYLRNAEGKCVLECDCPQCTNPNEVYDICPAPCPPRRCDVDERLIDCIPPPRPGDPECKPGCRCADGFVRNREGICVTRDQCPTCTGPNEEYDVCPATCPPQRCDVDPSTTKCAAPPKPGDPKCKPGCRCIDGHVRNDDGKCIPRDQCPQNCKGKHEIYSRCPALADRPLNCTQVGFPRPLINPGPDPSRCPGKPGCICEKDYARDSNGTCIPIKKCPSCGGDPNAVSGCGGNCGRHCSDRNKKHPVECNKKSKDNGCDCREGFWYDDITGKCVLPEDCTTCTGQNEEYDVCPAPCPSQRCDVDPSTIKCAAPPKPGDPKCKPGCRCIDGHVRNDDGKCIPRDQCPQNCKGKHEIYSRCPALADRPLNCTQVGFPRPLINPGPDPSRCPGKPGCICENDYARDSNGTCIPIKKCPSCGGDPNAVSGCGGNCGRHCSDRNKKHPVECNKKSKDNGCDCREGFWYDDTTGKCVLPEDCTTCTGQNEEYDVCPAPCPSQRCDVDPSTIKCEAPPKPGDPKCKPGCRCIDGHVRNDDGKCIPRDQCPQNCKGKHEIYSRCPALADRPLNCTQVGFPRPLINPGPDPSRCPGKPGCICENDYARDSNGTCIPIKKCPSCGGDPNAVSGCGGNCGRHCSDRNKKHPVECNKKSKDNGCDCREGFWYDDITGKCVLTEDCTTCTGQNEEYDVCPAPCPSQRCDVDPSTIKCAAPPKPGDPKCKPGCRCIDGHVRNDEGKCIPRDQCPQNCKGKHEIYSRCPALADRPLNCTQVGFPRPLINPGPDPSRCPGKPGCICENDYARDSNGTCIPIKKCPSCGGDPNAVSGCGGNCGRQCSDRNKKHPVECNKKCKDNGCDCREGFWYDDTTGKCVLPEDCTTCTGPNEEYDVCPATCPPQRCDVDPRVIKCEAPPKPGDPKCKPGCRCIDGHVRNDDGKCIPRDQCPQNCKGEHEIYSRCPALADRPLNCTQVGFPRPLVNPGPDPSLCPGKPGCICENDYARDSNGTCIPIKTCPSCGGDPNAESGCGDNCGRHCSDRNKKHPVECNKKCKDNGCVCREGFWYDDNTGKCVLPEDCTTCTGPNEEYDVCPATCPPQRCDVDPSTIKCAAPPKPGDPKCKPGCRCIDGHVRNDDGKCIPRDQCPQNCKGEHEIYSRCPALADRPLNCTQVGFPRPLVNPGPDPSLCPGKPGCICENDYARDSNGTCIPIKTCPSCGGDPNAESGCGDNCGRHCSDRNKKHPVECNKKCKDNGCVCREGFWYDDNTGKCVLPEDCTPVCGEDEVYSACTNSDCQPKNCSQLGFPIPCPRIDLAHCIKGCSCKVGFLRAANGTCIPKEKCPSCRGDTNAVSGCGQNCGRRCSNYNSTKPVICTEICEINGCDCREGFVLDDSTGKCIRPNQCVSCGGDFNAEPGCDQNCDKRCPGPKPAECKCFKDGCVCKDDFVYDPKVKKCVRLEQCTPPCGNNEVLSNCSNSGCGPWRCTDVGFRTGCVKMDLKYCQVDCVCKEGYVRDDDEVCIPVTGCPECGGDPNAVAGCGINCGRLCSNYKNAEDVSCIAECLENACDCRKGFVKDENTDRCVLPKDCTQVCGENEVFSPCVNDGCEARNCSQIGESVACVKPAECKPGCLCAEGFLRDANGKCIPKDKCPPKCKGANEIYDPCPPSCPPQTCESIGQKYFCPLMLANKTSEDCHGACRCKPNFFRNKLGDCISEKNCLKCTGPHEFFSCGGACDNVCETLDKQNQTRCPIINIKCNEKCYCEEGYARNKNNTCIPIDQCPGKCRENERWEECPAWLCSQQSCKDLGFEKTCANAENSTCPGPPGCVCDYNYVRDENGKCIPEKECPSCGGDPNAEAGCGLNCGRLCSNYNKGPVPCPRICKHNACDCKKDYVFDQNINKCVLPKHCTPVCKEHEVYSECTNGECQARNCSQLGNPVPCVKLDPKSCIKGCVCEEGYLRARNGTCVPVEKCDNCNKPHEHYDSCAPSCSPQTCESIGRKYKCLNTAAVCKGACRCDKGYFRNKKGECIRKKDCFKCTGPHEFFSCGGACDNVCETLDKQNQTRCPIINIKCNEKCYCEEGYARNKNNTCIPIDQCPGKCRENERWEECPAWLCSQQSCKDLGFEKTCANAENSTCPGPPGCICDYNYVRDENGKCIPEKECPSCGGDPNAEAGCGLNCGRLCSNYNKGPVPCPRICKHNACDCKKDYVFDQNINKCVLPKHCTPVCKEHEVYSECTNGECQARNCSQLGNPVPCVKLDPKSCIKGCVCEEGYLRARNGTCVPVEKCDNCNKPHEHYDSCAPSCPPQTCESIGRKYKCLNTAAVCKGACRCDKGYFRNKKGECIRKKDCLKCKGPHEYFSCGSACDNVCSTLHKQNQTNCPIKNIKCNRMCYCEEGYARNKHNVCIPIDECPKPRCGVNERLEQCPPGLCTPQKCSQLGFPYPCPDLPEYGCPEPPGCVCIDDYVRDSRGRCIPNKDCPSCGGDPNAVSGCGMNCDRTCSTYNRTGIACAAICYFNACDCRKGFIYDENLNKCVRPKDCTPTCKKHEVYDSCANGGCGKWNCSQLGQPDLCIDVTECIGGCICQKGYLRARNGTCVPIKQCPKPSCGKNERFEFCPDSICEPQKCTELGFPVMCPAVTGDFSCPGQPACICDNGFVRNNDGVCIPKKNCPSCGGDRNAQSGCGINCGRLCSNYKKERAPCPKICKLNACDCKKGFVFDVNTKKCVRPKQCTPTCGKDEVYSECINGGCQPKNCSQLGKPVPCPKIDPKYCIKGCLCKEGYLRETNGVCVPKEECRGNCWKPHEVYDPCPPTCPPQTCESINKKIHCPLIKIDKKDCKPACRCKEGYFRNKIGECILKENCLKCTGPNEYFSCGGACDNVCATLHKQNQTNCPIINFVCNPMCYCEKGYARDDKNVCVPIEKCSPPKCGKHERLEDSPDRLCTPQSCSQLGYPIDCPAIQDDSSGNKTRCPGRPGCVCIDNYVRDDSGKCIPKKNCPSCGGDPNAVSGCGSNCGRLCSNYKKKVVLCTLECKLNGCDCRKGFVFDSNLNKCVRPKHCTQVCGLNEVYDMCANGGCQKRNCSQLGQFMLCKDPIKCTGGCVCKKGFLRSKNGTCIPQDKCPLKCTKLHEVYDRCPRTCPPQTCAAIGKAYPCPHPPEGEEFCQPACRCEDGYYRNSVGECISEADCLKCTKPNEHFSCGPACDNVCATLATQNQTNCPIKNKKCNPKCYCDEGYARDDNDMCIPIDQCGVSCKGDPNAVEGCGNHCGQSCSTYNNRVIACPLSCMLNGCDCKPGYIFDDNLDKCVLPKDCTPICGNDEVYNTCINGGCQKKNCSDLGRPKICAHPKECIDGCLCKEGFLRAKNGTCVPIDKCPTPVCPKHEVFDRCANGGCNRRKCSELTGPIISRDPIECIGDCVCVKGYLRNDDGVCVRERNCNPQCNRPHEVFNHCPSTCPPQTCESLDRAYICPIERGEDPPCQPGCVCEEGFYTNKIGECVSEKDCLKCMGPHEYYSCGGACDNVCATLKEQNQTNCPIVNIQCNKMCYCEEGYARNASNICIPIKDCPLSRCGPDERYVESPCRVCEPLTCCEVGMEIECPPVVDDDCDDTPACICKHGLVRNDDGVCIPICECPSENTTVTVNITEARARLDQGSVALSGKFLHYLVSSKPDENCVASATSLMIPLAQLGLYAKDLVLEQILKLIGLQNKEEIRACFPELTAEFNNQTNVVFEEATKYYANKVLPLSQPFRRDSSEIFQAGVENVDFSKNVESAALINKWVSDSTHGKIQDLVTPDMFSSDTTLCLVNAIYFLGNWVKQFNPRDTQTKDFHKSNGETVPLEIMYQQNTFNYAENDQYQVLEMFYRGNNFSFMVVLPRNKEDLLVTLETIGKPDEWDNIMESLEPQRCDVYLPKMLISTETGVKTMLQKYGASEMFNPNSNGLEGILETPARIYVSDAVQKAFIQVDESGTEAAAATAVMVGLTSAMYPRPKPYEFLATRPFAFYILLRSEKSPYKTPLFCGTFVGAK